MSKKLKSLGVKIAKTAHFLPPNIVTNQDIIERYNLRLKDSWVIDNIGISERRWCENEKASDLGSHVLRELLKDNIKTQMLIVSTVSSDIMTPATACIIQSNVTPGDTYPAFDITSACAGLSFAIDMGIKYIQSGLLRVSCVATETRSYYLDKQDRRTVMLFADGASGLNLEKSNNDEVGIFYSKIITDGRFWNSIVVPGSGSEVMSQKTDSRPVIEMRDASGIFEEAIKQMTSLVMDALTENDLGVSDINHFIFHQASANIVKTAAKNLNLEQDQYTINFDRIGNTTSASVGILLDELVLDKKIKKGDYICLIATGGGFSAGLQLFRWEY